jgi:hypothetical protein
MNLEKNLYLKNISYYISEIFRKINITILFFMILIVLGINYELHKILSNQNMKINDNIAKINTYREDIDNNTKVINSLQNLKTDKIYLVDKVTAINAVKTILRQHNMNYILNVNVPEKATTGNYFNGLNNSDNNFLEAKTIISKDAKMGVFHYIPIQITITNYVNYDNLMDAVNQLTQNNLIITQVSSSAKYAKLEKLVLGGRLYVSK